MAVNRAEAGESIAADRMARPPRRAPPFNSALSPDALILSRSTGGLCHGRLSKRDQPPSLLIPQSHPHTAQTLQQGDSSDGGELWVVPQHIRQPIAGNSTGQVVDMLDADVRREPAQNSRQVIVRAAMQRSFVKAPGPVMGP